MTTTDSVLYGQKGQRKQRVSLQTLVFLLAGLGIAAWTKLDFQIYLCYVAGCIGGNTAFMWANSKENQSDATIIAAGKTPPP